ncbi:dapper homolog 1-like [Brienomyrus brachyistius]|uniref:dapper homolog 1-like n=1 Tax=Brienomyrus brachyistius TaxID=42636 RepID=UPI0020B405B6|nr:dapper homolog 1-like [Brienomyrus brachyistius]
MNRKMAGDCSYTQCSPWSQPERRRVRERFQAALAGLLELEVLRYKHKKMVEAILKDGSPDPQSSEKRFPLQPPGGAPLGKDGFRVPGGSGGLRFARSLSQDDIDHLRTARQPKSQLSRSTENLLLHYSHIDDSVFHLVLTDSGSRASSGFYDDDEDSQAGAGGSTLSGSRASLVGSEAVTSPELDAETIPSWRLQCVASLCPESHWQDVRHMLQPQLLLEPRYRVDLRTGRSSEVYRYPSPLHAVALQSPLYGLDFNRTTLNQEDHPGRHMKYLSLPTYLSTPQKTTGQPSSADSDQRRLQELILSRARGYHRMDSTATLRKCKESNSLLPGLAMSTLAGFACRRADMGRSWSIRSEVQAGPWKFPYRGFSRVSSRRVVPSEHANGEFRRKVGTLTTLKGRKLLNDGESGGVLRLLTQMQQTSLTATCQSCPGDAVKVLQRRGAHLRRVHPSIGGASVSMDPL